MMSLRAAARSAPRTVSRLSSGAATAARHQQFSAMARSSAAWAPLRSTVTRQQQQQILQGARRGLSTTALRAAKEKEKAKAKAEGASQVDEELSTKLESELQFENEMKENEQLPASVKDFLENSPFELKDIPGNEEVVLSRKFGNETVTVTFSVNDLTNYDPEQNFEDEGALGEEEMDTPEGRRLEAEAEAEAEEDRLENEEDEHPVPFRLNVVVEKPGQGALNIEALAQAGSIMVESFYYFKEPRHAHSDSAEITHAAQDIYPGPPFASLDEDLQILLERYLEERGVTQALAVFVPDYMDLKEQREYQAWLQNVKNFIDA